MLYKPVLRTGYLRKLCDERRWNVEDFADAGGFSPATTYRVLNGRTRPSAEFIAACAVLFGADSLPNLFRFVRISDTATTFAPQLARTEDSDDSAA